MALIGLTVTDLMDHMPTDHQLANTFPDTANSFTIAAPENFGIDMDDAPIYTDPALVAVYVRGFIDGQTHSTNADNKEAH